MNTMRTMLIGAALGALLAGPAAAQASASAQATGSAEIIDPARISQESSLTVANVTRPTAGAKTAVAGGASYTVTGQGGETYTISAPSSLKLVRAGGTEEIELTLTPSSTTGAFGGSSDRASAATIKVTGSAPVTSTTPTGLYQGEYGLTLSYQ
jgi:hypothetical protein